MAIFNSYVSLPEGKRMFYFLTIWLCNSLPWKDPPFLRTLNHLYISMGHLYHGYVWDNQSVIYRYHRFLTHPPVTFAHQSIGIPSLAVFVDAAVLVSPCVVLLQWW